MEHSISPDAKSRPIRHLARVTIEFTTPFHLGSGRPGEISDAAILTDANDLPTIPGSSIAGVLRHQFESCFGTSSTNDVFGYQNGDKGHGSALSISWACIHNQQNNPCEGLIDSEKIQNDPVLQSARAPTLRDHVRINHGGVADADGHGKFDELVVHAGHRFTFALEFRCSDSEAAECHWTQLMGVLQSPSFRLGGKTRRGFGAVKLVSLHQQRFDLSIPAEFTDYCNYPVRLSKPLEGTPPSTSQADPFASLQLTPRHFWMFGGGADLPAEQGNALWSAADAAPVRDTRILWTQDNKGKPTPDVLYIPGSSLKGAIAHRTAFHYNRLTRNYVRTDDYPDGVDPDNLQSNPAVDALFGTVKTSKSDQGSAGKVFIPDLYLEEIPQSMKLQHVAIDRFTGGASAGALFDERPLYRGQLPTIGIHVDTNAIQHEDENILKAFKLALEDLANARLPIGASSGRGHGFMEGSITFQPDSTPTPVS